MKRKHLAGMLVGLLPSEVGYKTDDYFEHRARSLPWYRRIQWRLHVWWHNR